MREIEMRGERRLRYAKEREDGRDERRAKTRMQKRKRRRS